MTKIAYLDCSAGVTCEMLLGGLVNCGLSLVTVNERLASLSLTGYTLVSESVPTNKGSCVTVTQPAQPPPAYTWAAIKTLLASSHVSPFVGDTTLTTLQTVRERLASRAGTQATDTVPVLVLARVISILVGLQELGITQLSLSPLPLTSGQTSHNKAAAPTPATLEILRRAGAVWQPSTGASEGISLLIAALFATLGRFDMPPFSIERVGYGYSVTSAQAKRLCLYLGTVQREAQEADTDWVTLLSTNIDNMSGELLGGVMERLLAVGALDVSYTPMQMKKNRPATMITVMCPLEKSDELAYLLLRETTTLGVRVQQVQRLKAQRTAQLLDTPLGPMVIKVKRLGTKIVSAAAEYEECQRIASEHKMPLADVYGVAQHWIAKTILYIEEKN